jgi:hypothetical protein
MLDLVEEPPDQFRAQRLKQIGLFRFVLAGRLPTRRALPRDRRER